jgi:hypothetical protein
VVVGRRQFVDVMDAHARIDFGRFHQVRYLYSLWLVLAGVIWPLR